MDHDIITNLKDYCSCISSLISFLFFLHPALIPCEKQELQEKKRENSKSNCLHYYVKGGQETSRITESRKGGSYLRPLAMMLKTGVTLQPRNASLLATLWCINERGSPCADFLPRSCNAMLQCKSPSRRPRADLLQCNDNVQGSPSSATPRCSNVGFLPRVDLLLRNDTLQQHAKHASLFPLAATMAICYNNATPLTMEAWQQRER